MIKRIFCGVMAALFTFFTLSGCQNTATSTTPSSAEISSTSVMGSRNSIQIEDSSNSSSQNKASTASAQASKEYLKTDPAQGEAYNAAINAYNEFLRGKISAVDKAHNKTFYINGMNSSNNPGIISYALYDVNGDVIPELHTRSRCYDIFSYRNGQITLWYDYSGTSSGYPLILENKAVFAVFTSTGRSYEYTTFSKDGTATKITFFDAASYDGDSVSENAPYYFYDKQVSKEEYETLTKEYIALSKKTVSIEWHHYEY